MEKKPQKSFAETARAAFPVADRALAEQAISHLTPLVDDTRRHPTSEFDVLGQKIRLPSRLHFPRLLATDANIENMPQSALCLISCSTDGYLRQKAIYLLLKTETSWVAPYVTVLAAEYVLEIAEIICDGLPTLNRAIYANFVLENRAPIRTLRARATSYWDAYHRHLYPEKKDYPGLKALHEMERWAAA